MTQSFRNFSGEVAAEIYNHTLPASAKEFLDLLEPISEKSFELLTCFNHCKNLDEVFTTFSEHFHDISGSLVEENVFGLGCYDSEHVADANTASLQPDWLIVGVRDELQRYFRYFKTFREAVEFIVQISAINQMAYELDWNDPDFNWRSVVERQLATACAVIQWHTLGGYPQQCIDYILKSFCNEGVVLFKAIKEYILEDLITDSDFNKILYDYQAEFFELPCFYDLDQTERWAWFLPYLPDFSRK